MLVLSRNDKIGSNQIVFQLPFGAQITVSIHELKRSSVKIAIDAPPDVRICRNELTLNSSGQLCLGDVLPSAVS